MWSLPDGKSIHSQSVFPSNKVSTDANENNGESTVVHATLCKNLDTLAIVTYDHNILFYDLDSFNKRKEVSKNPSCLVSMFLLFLYLI